MLEVKKYNNLGLAVCAAPLPTREETGAEAPGENSSIASKKLKANF